LGEEEELAGACEERGAGGGKTRLGGGKLNLEKENLPGEISTKGRERRGESPGYLRGTSSKTREDGRRER